MLTGRLRTASKATIEQLEQVVKALAMQPH